MRTTMKIEGMQCDGCASTLQRMLGKQQGVRSAKVDLVSATAIVEYDEGVINVDQLVHVINNCGFTIIE